MTDAPTTTTPETAAPATAAPNAPATATTTTTPPADTGKAPDAAKAPDGKPATATDDLLFQDKKEKPEAEGDKKPDEKDKSPDADKKDGEQPSVKAAELTIPEDMTLPEDMQTGLDKLIVDRKLDKETAQAVVDLGVKMQQSHIDYFQKMKSDWREEVKADPVYGGKNLDASVANANDIVRKYGDDALVDDLVMLGLGNKVSFVRFLNKLHGATKEDDAGGGKSTGGDATKKPANEVLWPNMATK